jgi:hypothetical protein
MQNLDLREKNDMNVKGGTLGVGDQVGEGDG